MSIDYMYPNTVYEQIQFETKQTSGTITDLLGNLGNRIIYFG